MMGHPEPRRKFKWLLAASIIGFPVFVVLHNVLAAVAEMTPAIVEPVLGVLSAACFMTAIVICPAAFIIAVVGLVVTAV